MVKKKTRKRREKEFSNKDIDDMAQRFREAVEECPDENEEVFPHNGEDLRNYILTLKENMKVKPTEHLREELRVYEGYQTGLYNGFCMANEYIMSKADKIREEEAEEEIKHPLEENAYKHDPNYEFKPLTYEQLDTYDAISYGPFLGIPWEEFNKMIKLYCKKRGREGEWKTNEFGTQTFHFKND